MLKVIPREPVKNIWNFRNKFKILEVEDCVSYCDDKDVTKYISLSFESMTGGCGVSNKSESPKKTKSTHISSTANEDPAIQSGTLKVITSAKAKNDNNDID